MSDTLREEAKERGRLRSLFFSETGKISSHYKSDFDTFCKQQEIAALTAKLAAAEQKNDMHYQLWMSVVSENTKNADALAAAELALVEAQAYGAQMKASLEAFPERTDARDFFGAHLLATIGRQKALALKQDTTALDAHVKRVCGEPVAEVRNGQTIWYNGWPAYGTKLCIAPAFTDDAKGEGDE